MLSTHLIILNYPKFVFLVLVSSTLSYTWQVTGFFFVAVFLAINDLALVIFEY